MAKRGNKKPKHTQTPTPTKKAKHTKNPEGYQHQLIAWHFHRMDSGGNWPCNHKTIKPILPRLHEYEKKRWFEIMQQRRNHPMPTNKIESQAQQRLTDLGIGDTGTLYQLEIKGAQRKPRLWGTRQENIFQILWWDPNHTVYTPKKPK